MPCWSGRKRERRCSSALHANIQDAFNEEGVQIMSPHYVADPEAPKLVPPGEWEPTAPAGVVQRPEIRRPHGI